MLRSMIKRPQRLCIIFFLQTSFFLGIWTLGVVRYRT
jgi:hypothetical protein